MIKLSHFDKMIEDLFNEKNITVYNSKIMEIADKLNIDVIFTYSHSTVIKNNLNNKIIIILNKNLEYQEQKLAFFHELTHILLDHLTICESLNNFELKYLERKTNEFSLAVALPKHEINQLIHSKKYINISEISDLYEISSELVEKRLSQIKK